MTETTERACLVCGHSADDHGTDRATCVGTEGLCQCHAYNPDEHPAQRLAARRENV
ncbi:hypothetical protein ACXR2U_11965 [Jatrophihabitans sp. YIM 134969]